MVVSILVVVDSSNPMIRFPEILNEVEASILVRYGEMRWSIRIPSLLRSYTSCVADTSNFSPPGIVVLNVDRRADHFKLSAAAL